MSATLRINNFDDINLGESSTFAAEVQPGDVQIELANTANLKAGRFVILGNLGAEDSELQQILTVDSDKLVTVTGVDHIHRSGESVTALFGNKIRLYRAAYTGAGMPASEAYELVGTDYDINGGELFTDITDGSGSSAFWYKSTFYNSLSTAETSLDNAIASRPGGSTNYTSLSNIRDEAGFDGAEYITDAKIERRRQAAQSEVNNALAGRYVVPFPAPISHAIADITTRLAAGLLMCDEYGSYDSSDKSRGEKKRDDARADLMRYQDGTYILLDAQGTDTTVDGGGGFSAQPDQYSNPRMFSTDQIQGYRERHY